MKAALFDYGTGNLHSLEKALEASGASVDIGSDLPVLIDAAEVLVLPGVGAFGPAAARLEPYAALLRSAINSGLPTLGICLGMQLLFDSSEEGPGKGLGIFEGEVTALTAQRVPHIGWNTLDGCRDRLIEKAHITTAYFANGFACRPSDPEIIQAWTEHDGDRFPAAVRRGHVVGVQFHPEKSSGAGLAFLRSFLEEV